MALSSSAIGEKAVRHSDPNSRLHNDHVRQAAARRIVDKVIVNVQRDDARRLNVLGNQWEVRWEGWNGDTFLVEQTTYSFITGNKVRTKLKKVSGKEFNANAARINRLDWYWSARADKGVRRKVKRKVERNRLGKVVDRHTVTFSPPQMRLLQKLKVNQCEAARLLTSLQEKSVGFFAAQTKRHVVASAAHTDSGILHWDILSSRIDPDHNLCGNKSLPSLANESWSIGAWRQRDLGCNLTFAKNKWLTQNLAKFQERHGEEPPLLLQLHQKLDKDFDEWVKDHGHSKLWEQSKREYRDWVAETDPIKEAWAEERAGGKAATKLAERIAMEALRMVLPPPVYGFVKGTLTATQIVSDLLELNRNSSATGLLLQIALTTGLMMLKDATKSPKHRPGRSYPQQAL